MREEDGGLGGGGHVFESCSHPLDVLESGLHRHLQLEKRWLQLEVYVLRLSKLNLEHLDVDAVQLLVHLRNCSVDAFLHVE